MSKRKHNHLENLFYFPDGSYGWFDLSIQPVPEGVFILSIDITERKLAERSLRESEEKYRKAFKTSPDSVNINRLADGMYISVNPGFLETMEYTESEVIGKTSIEINVWKNTDDRKKLVNGLISKGFIKNLEAKFCSKNGKVIDGLMSAALIDIEGIPHILSITRDISELRLNEANLRYNEALLKEVGRLAKIGGWELRSGLQYLKLDRRSRPDL